jgi:hypothetical protein
VSSSECVSTTMATLGFDICLISIIGFFGFNFYHIYFLRFGVIFSNWLSPQSIGRLQHLFTDILEYLFHKNNFVDRTSRQTLWHNGFCRNLKFWQSHPTYIPLCFSLWNHIL